MIILHGGRRGEARDKKTTTAEFIPTWMVGKQLNTAAHRITMQLLKALLL